METPRAGLAEFPVRTYVLGGGGGVTLPPLPQAMRSRVRQIAIQSAGLMRGVTGLRIIDLRIMERVVMGPALPVLEGPLRARAAVGADGPGAVVRVRSFGC